MYLGELPTQIQSFAYVDQRWGLATVTSSIIPCMDSKENTAKIQYNANFISSGLLWKVNNMVSQ